MASANVAAGMSGRPGWIGEKMNDQKTGVIIGIPNMAEYLSVSRQTIYRYMGLGMPGNKINDTWHFHIKNVEEWFQIKTAVIRKDMVEEIRAGAFENEQHQ